MKPIELICSKCDKKFLRKYSEYTRGLKRGRKIFCSQVCHGKASVIYLENTRSFIPLKKWIEENGQHKKLDELSAFRLILKRLGSKKYPNIDINLTYLKNLWDKQKGLCAITNIPMVIRYHSEYKRTTKTHPKQMSLDRINNNLPYQQENVRFVCLMYNYMRNKFSDEEVEDFIKSIKINQGSVV